MNVAPPAAGMRLSEIVIIYLAAAAPSGVTFFLRHAGNKAARRDVFLQATGAALVWPAWLVVRLARRARSRVGPPSKFDEAAVERAKTETTDALRRAEDAFFSGRPAHEGDDARHEFFAARASAERYAGLALACVGARADEPPSAREKELCRVAGRAGDDLMLAGRCVHRRNVTRLVAHRERARAELESSLARLCSAVRRPPQGAAVGTSGELAAALAGAAKLLSALGDTDAAARVAGLLSRGRPRRAEPADGAGVQSSEDPPKGAPPCTTQAAHTAFAGPPRSATTSTRG